MLIFWTILLVVPLVGFIVGLIAARERLLALFDRFAASRRAAVVLTVIGWFWTAHECNTIGIDVFDMLLKRFPGQLWIMAVALSYLTCLWMAKHLSVRALMGIFMLIPAEAFKATRLAVPDGGFAPVQLLVAVIYLYAIVGMYGMFYPWRIERAVRWLCGRRAAETRS